MLKKLVLIVLTAGVIQTALGQTAEETKKKVRIGQPNIPGTFLVDFGLAYPSENEVGFNTGFWGSRTLNIYYQADKQIGQSKFSVHPGAGFGFERYKFNNEKTLSYIPGPNSPFDTLRMVQAITGTKKSQLITNYVDALFEVQFTTNPNDPARSFKASLGFKAGVLLNAQTKIKYRENGETKKLKDRQDWNVTPFRYGLTLRAGVGNFGVFGYYSLTPIFEKGKGPDQAEIDYFTVGIFLNGF